MDNKDHPIWDLYDLHASSLYWINIYEDQILRFNKRINYKDIIIALFATSSAISGFTIWQTSFGKAIWGIGVSIAAILAIIGPILNWNDKLLFYKEILTNYKELDSDCNILMSEIKMQKEFSDDIFKKYEVLHKKRKEADLKRPVLGLSLEERKRYQQLVFDFLPRKSFYVPEN